MALLVWLLPVTQNTHSPTSGASLASLCLQNTTYFAVQEEEDFALPQQLQAQMAAYAARFSIVKTPRKLVWMKHLGSVDLTLTVGPREVDFTVTPIHAAIIMHFKVGHLTLSTPEDFHDCRHSPAMILRGATEAPFAFI